MPWILFFFMGAGVAALASAKPSKPKAKGRFVDARISKAEFKRQILTDPTWHADLIAGAPYRLVDVVAMASRLLDYSFEYGNLPATPSPTSFDEVNAKKSWTSQQYLGNVLVGLRSKVALYSGALPNTGWSYTQKTIDDQTRVRAILFEVVLPILAGQVVPGSHPSLKATKNALKWTGNVGPVGSDRPIWVPWSPLRAYVNKDVPGGTLSQQDFIRSATTWALAYFLQPSTACFYADKDGKPVRLWPPTSGNAVTDSTFYFPSQYEGWKKGSPGWRYSRDPVTQATMLGTLYLYFRNDLDRYCETAPKASPSACDTVAAFNNQMLQPSSREEEARFLDDARRLQVFAEGNLQRMDVIANLAVANFAPREVKSFDWSSVLRIVLAAVAVAVQVVPGIGQTVSVGIAAAVAVTNAAIGFVRAAQQGGEQAAQLAYGFAAGIIDVLQRASLLTEKDLSLAKQLIGDARKAAGLAASAVDMVQQGNLGGATAAGRQAIAAGQKAAQEGLDAASTGVQQVGEAVDYIKGKIN